MGPRAQDFGTSSPAKDGLQVHSQVTIKDFRLETSHLASILVASIVGGGTSVMASVAAERGELSKLGRFDVVQALEMVSLLAT